MGLAIIPNVGIIQHVTSKVDRVCYTFIPQSNAKIIQLIKYFRSNANKGYEGKTPRTLLFYPIRHISHSCVFIKGYYVQPISIAGVFVGKELKDS